MFNRLRANKGVIQRSGLLALAYVNRIIHGIDEQAGATAVADLIQIRVIHNNAESVLAFMAKFRELRSKLGESFRGKARQSKVEKHNQKAPEDVTDWKCESRAFTSNPRRC